MSDVQPSRAAKAYTEELANRALPLVRRIVDDLVSRFHAWQDAVSRFEYATAKSTADAPIRRPTRCRPKHHESPRRSMSACASSMTSACSAALSTPAS